MLRTEQCFFQVLSCWAGCVSQGLHHRKMALMFVAALIVLALDHPCVAVLGLGRGAGLVRLSLKEEGYRTWYWQGHKVRGGPLLREQIQVLCTGGDQGSLGGTPHVPETPVEVTPEQAAGAAGATRESRGWGQEPVALRCVLGLAR